LQAEQAREPRRHLGIKLVLVVWIDKADSLLDVVVIQERNEEASRVSM
jgi:hypothetical protein